MNRYAVLVVIASFITSTAGAENKLAYGSYAPESYPNSIAASAFFKRVERDSGGAVKFETHWNGSVVNIRTSLPGVRDRLVDAAYVTGSLFGQEFKADIMFADFAAVAADTRAITGAATETLLLNCQECRTEAARAKVVMTGYSADAPFYLMCRDPVTSLDQLRGKSVRAVLAFALLAKSWGATPVNTAPGEIYEALQRGQVNCVIGGGFWLKSYNLWDVAKNVIDVPLGQYNNGGVFTVNAAVWKELDRKSKDAIVKNLPFLFRTAAYENFKQDRETRAESAAKGVKWHAPSADFVKHLADFRANEPARVVSTHQEKGVKDAAQYLATFQRNIAKWEQIVKETGGDPDKYEAALVEHVYSKVKF